MKGLLIGVQIISAISVIALVLMHTAKGEGLGGIGGQAKLFGTPKGLEEGLNRLTTGCAITFVFVSFILGLI